MDTMKNLQMMAFVQYLSALLTGKRSATMPLETECCDSFHSVAIYYMINMKSVQKEPVGKNHGHIMIEMNSSKVTSSYGTSTRNTKSFIVLARRF